MIFSIVNQAASEKLYLRKTLKSAFKVFCGYVKEINEIILQTLENCFYGVQGKLSENNKSILKLKRLKDSSLPSLLRFLLLAAALSELFCLDSFPPKQVSHLVRYHIN